MGVNIAVTVRFGPGSPGSVQADRRLNTVVSWTYPCMSVCVGPGFYRLREQRSATWGRCSGRHENRSSLPLVSGHGRGGHAYVHVCHEWLMKVALGEVGRETGTGGGKKIERIEYFRALKCP